MPSIQVPQLSEDCKVLSAADLLQLQQQSNATEIEPGHTDGPCCLCTSTCLGTALD